MENNITYSTAVENLQRYFRRLADNGENRELYALPIDGIYDTKTRAAVSEFQSSRGLPSTGVVDMLTWDSLFAEYEELTRTRDRRNFPDFFPRTPENYATELGEESAFISVLQLVIDELRVAYGTLPPFEMNGKYDEQTVLAVREFQRLSAIPVTGRVDLHTWNTLSEAFNRYATESN